MYHFYVEPEAVTKDTVRITGGDVNHIKNVLRMHPQEEIIVLDGAGMEYRCKIETISEEVIARVLEAKKTEAELSVRLLLFQGLPKKDKMELIIQKAVELGVSEIIPVLTKRTVVKLEDKKKEQKKLERWQAIAEAAAKQSGRGIIPKVREAVKFTEAVKQAKELDEALIPYELAEGMEEARKRIRGLHDKQTIGIFIGPEGGFEEDEVAIAANAGIHPITLGKRILRTETAGLCILSVIMFELEK